MEPLEASSSRLHQSQDRINNKRLWLIVRIVPELCLT